MPQLLTKSDLTKALYGLHDGIRGEMRENTRGLVKHFNESQAKQNTRLDEIHGLLTEAHTKLDAIMSLDVIATCKQLLTLMRALKAKGIELDEAEILAA